MIKREIKIFILLLWIYGTFGFWMDSFPSLLIPIKSTLYFICDLLIVILTIKYIRKRIDLFFVSSFIVLSFLSSFVYNKIDFITYINGIRDYIPFLFVPVLLKAFMTNKIVFFYLKRNMDIFILRFLQLQLPCSIYQFFIYGAGDSVGGSFGQFGYSGILTQIVYLGTFHLLRNKIDSNDAIKSIWKNKTYFLYLIPSFINETKVSFILLPILFILLLHNKRKLEIKKLIVTPLVVCVILFLFSIIYIDVNKNSSDIFTLKYYTTMYMYNDNSVDFSQTQYGTKEDIPRFSKIKEGYNLLKLDKKLLVGEGIGHFKGGTNLKLTPFANKYRWLLNGSIPYLFFIVIQIGILGFTWCLILIIFYLKKGFKNRNNNSFNILVYQIVIFIIILFYNDSFRSPVWGIIFMYILMYAIYDKKRKIIITDK